jgi:hypothetical protein
VSYALDRELRDGAGRFLGTFSSHWAACAAMIRLSDPGFRSMGGDKPEDLAVERQIARRRCPAAIQNLLCMTATPF